MGKTLVVQGSSNLMQTLHAHDLIDEFRLMIFPVLLGKGKRLFEEGALPAAFKVTSSVTTSKGVVIACYERVGEVKTASFG